MIGGNSNSIEIEKIIVSPDDELIDILKALENTTAKKVILTFAEHSDLLISPINLKVIQDLADDLEIPVISLIIQNPTGVRNAREAQMTVTETSGSIVDSFWEDAENSMMERIKNKQDSLKSKNVKPKEIEESEKEVFIDSENAINPEEYIQKPIENREKSEFQKSVEEALLKSKAMLSEKGKIINENGVTLALDQDLPQDESSKPATMTGKSFKHMPTTHITNTEETEKPHLNIPKFNIPKLPQIKGSWGFVLLKILVPVLSVLIISAWIAYISLPLVRIKIFVESKGVSIEKVFAGDTKTTEFSVDNGTVPVKKEEVSKSASNSTKATGVDYKGEKAVGEVKIKYYDFVINGGKNVTLKAGTVLTSSKGLKFQTTADVLLNNFLSGAVPVQALAVGEEYNLAAGQLFTIAGYTQSQMDASNLEAFGNGSKTAITVFSKTDLDKVVNDLKKNLGTEGEGELRGKADSEWELIDKSLKTDLDGDPITDVKVGEVADTVNITVKTKTSALYYQKNSIDKGITDLLTKTATNQNIFQTNNDSQFVLDENINKSIDVTEVKNDAIKVSVKASANVKPKVDKDSLMAQLKGKGWKEGLSILDGVKYTDKQNEIEFIPSYFPEWLRYFPTRQGRIFIYIEEVVK